MKTNDKYFLIRKNYIMDASFPIDGDKDHLIPMNKLPIVLGKGEGVDDKHNLVSKEYVDQKTPQGYDEFHTGEKVNSMYINQGTTDKSKILITQLKLEDTYTIPMNTKIDTNKTKSENNASEISTLKTNVDTNKSDITNLKNDKLNNDFSNAHIDQRYDGKYPKVDNGRIVFDTPAGGGSAEFKNGDDTNTYGINGGAADDKTLLTKDNIENNYINPLEIKVNNKADIRLSNILKPTPQNANIITGQATKVGDKNTSEVKINTIYTDLTVNGYGVFVNGNRIDSSMEWKDITNTWKTRNWSKDDVGKQVRITTDHAFGHVVSGILMWDNLMMEMVFCFQFFSPDGLGQRLNYGYWRSSYLGKDNVVNTSILWNATAASPLVNVLGSEPGWSEITKFEIFENVNVPEPKLTLTFDNYKQYTTWFGTPHRLEIDNSIQQISNVFMSGFIIDPTKPTQVEEINELALPNQLEVIETNAFLNAKLTSLVIPNNTIAIGDNSFADSNILNLTIGNSVISIGDRAFQNSTMSNLSIPNSVVNIGDDAFQNSQLTKLRLDLNVKTIGQYAFEKSPLEELHIGLQVESIGNLAFWNTVNSPKTKVYLPAKFDSDSEKDRIFGKGGWDQITFFLPTLILDNTNYQKYSIYDTTTKQLQVLRPITEISNIFRSGYPDGSGGNLPIETLDLPNSLYKIDDNAFQYIQITTLTIPNGVETIGNLAFANVNTLTTLTLGNNVKTIGTQAFYYAKLTSLEIPDSVITIGNRAFTNSYLTSLTIGNSLETIVEWAFKETRITSLVFPSTLKSIGTGAFLRAPLTHLEIPNSCNHIDSKAFSGIVNNSSTTVSMPSAFNTKKQKDSIFNSHWNHITFTWT